jgi:hypothetical protein
MSRTIVILKTILVMGLLVIAFWWALNKYEDLSIALTVATASLAILLRVIEWPLEDWLAVPRLKAKHTSLESSEVELKGKANGTDKVLVLVKETARPREIESFFKASLSETETKHYVIDLRTHMLLSVFTSLIIITAAIGIGALIEHNQNFKPDISRFLFGILPVAIQLTTMVSPMLHIKRRNEKALT